MIDSSLFLKTECLFGEEGGMKYKDYFFVNSETAKKLRDISVPCVSSWCHLDPLLCPLRAVSGAEAHLYCGRYILCPLLGLSFLKMSISALFPGFACFVLLLSFVKAFHN